MQFKKLCIFYLQNWHFGAVIVMSQIVYQASAAQ